MSKKNFITFVAILVGALAAFIAIMLFIRGGPGYTRITSNQAMREMPEVYITQAEFAVLRAAREDAIVQNALNTVPPADEKRVIHLPDENAAALFSTIVPENAELGDFMVIEDTMYIDYTRGNDRIILECLPDYRVRKSLARYTDINEPGIGDVRVYTNNNNESYRRY